MRRYFSTGRNTYTGKGEVQWEEYNAHRPEPKIEDYPEVSKPGTMTEIKYSKLNPASINRIKTLIDRLPDNIKNNIKITEIKQHHTPNGLGQYFHLSKSINLERDFDDKTFYHELFHHLHDLGDSVFPGISKINSDEESNAFAFADWAMGKENKKFTEFFGVQPNKLYEYNSISATKQRMGIPQQEIEASKPIPKEHTKTTLPMQHNQLYANWNGKKVPVDSLYDAKIKWEQFRDNTHGGVSEIGNGILITDQTGQPYATISYNGRIWATGGTEISPDLATAGAGPLPKSNKLTTPPTSVSKEPWQMTEREFNRNYYQHTDIRGYQTKTDNVPAIMRDGFNSSYYNLTGVTAKGDEPEKYSTKRGYTTFAVPKEWVKNTSYNASAPPIIKQGWKPKETEIVIPSRDNQPLHEAIIAKALSEGKPVPPEVLKDYPELIESKPKRPGNYGDWYTTPDNKFVKMQGSGGLGSNRVGTRDVNGNFAGYYNRDELKLIKRVDKPEETPEADRWLKEVTTGVDELKVKHESLLFQASLYDRFKQGVKTGQITDDFFKSKQAKGEIISDAEYDKAQKVRNQIEQIRNKPITPTNAASIPEKSLTELREINAERSSRSRAADNPRKNQLTIEHKDPRVARWKRDPGSMDVLGVDSPPSVTEPTSRTVRVISTPKGKIFITDPSQVGILAKQKGIKVSVPKPPKFKNTKPDIIKPKKMHRRKLNGLIQHKHR